MRSLSYSPQELIKISRTPEWKIKLSMVGKSVNDNLQFRKNLQVSLTLHKKELDDITQMEIICVTMMIERYCRETIMEYCKREIRAKYKDITEQKVKTLAKGKMEAILKKFSY